MFEEIIHQYQEIDDPSDTRVKSSTLQSSTETNWSLAHVLLNTVQRLQQVESQS